MWLLRGRPERLGRGQRGHRAFALTTMQYCFSFAITLIAVSLCLYLERVKTAIYMQIGPNPNSLFVPPFAEEIASVSCR